MKSGFNQEITNLMSCSHEGKCAFQRDHFISDTIHFIILLSSIYKPGLVRTITCLRVLFLKGRPSVTSALYGTRNDVLCEKDSKEERQIKRKNFSESTSVSKY